jgi:hypothetical protein
MQVLPQGRPRGEADFRRDPVDRQVAGLQEVPGAVHPLLDQLLAGARARLLPKAAGRRAPARPGVRGQLPQGERPVEVFQGQARVAPVSLKASESTGWTMYWAWPPSRQGGTTHQDNRWVGHEASFTIEGM